MNSGIGDREYFFQIVGRKPIWSCVTQPDFIKANMLRGVELKLNLYVPGQIASKCHGKTPNVIKQFRFPRKCSMFPLFRILFCITLLPRQRSSHHLTLHWRDSIQCAHVTFSEDIAQVYANCRRLCNNAQSWWHTAIFMSTQMNLHFHLKQSFYSPTHFCTIRFWVFSTALNGVEVPSCESVRPPTGTRLRGITRAGHCKALQIPADFYL